MSPDTTATIDRIPRYAPSKVLFTNSMTALMLPVTRYIVHPPNQHPAKCPIRAEMTALECQTGVGSRWFGCEHAYINSELRMVVVGFDARDEVRSKWEMCEVTV